MTQEEKQLLSTDLCARLPHGMYAEVEIWNGEKVPKKVYGYNLGYFRCDGFDYDIDEIKPYLRPMSSMTEEEFKELTFITELQYDQFELKDWGNCCKTLEFYLEEIPHYCVIKVFDWLNSHHFDYRELISMGLALEAPEGMYCN